MYSSPSSLSNLHVLQCSLSNLYDLLEAYGAAVSRRVKRGKLGYPNSRMVYNFIILFKWMMTGGTPMT